MNKRLSLRLLSLSLTVLMLFSFLGAGVVSASDNAEEDMFSYYIDENNQVYITDVSYDVDRSYIVIPETIEGLTVVGCYMAFAFSSYGTIVVPVTMKTMDQVFYKGDVKRIEYKGTRQMWKDDVSVSARNVDFECTQIVCADDKTYGDFIYGVADNEALIVEYTGKDSVLKIPDEIDGYPVTKIGGRAFWGNEYIEEVTLGKYVEKIMGSAFRGCPKLTDVYLPLFIDYIGYEAFTGSPLENIYYRGSQNMWPFVSYDEIMQDELGGYYTINEVITKAEKHFLNDGMSVLDGFEYYELESGICITGYTGESKDVIIPETISGKKVTDIYISTFYKNNDVKSIFLPKIFTDVPGYAFAYMKSLESVVLEEGIESIGNGVFVGCERLESVSIPSTVRTLGWNAFKNCCALKEITLPEEMDSIGDDAFDGCTALNNINMPKKLGKLGKSAFECCSSLESMVIPEGVRELDYTFSECTALESVTLPESLETLERGVFKKCSQLESVYIPQNVKSIHTGIFEGCPIKEIIVDEDNKVYDSRDNCNAIIETATNTLLIGADTTAIPQDIEIIGGSAFVGREFKEIKLPASVKIIGSHAFRDCKYLENVVIPEGVKKIGYMAFSSCESLESLVIPDSVIDYGGNVFELCKNLKEVTLPITANDIRKYEMHGCDSLTDIYFKGTWEQWYAKDITGVTVHCAKVHKGRGDVNCDGEINISDATKIQKYLVDADFLWEKGEVNADVDSSGSINIKDATAIQKWLVGIDTGFDIGK